MAVLAPLLAPYSPTTVDLSHRLQGLSGAHPLGTDEVGRDILSRMIYGAQVSLTIGLVGVLIGSVLGTILGMLAGYFSGLVDEVIMLLADMQLAFPFILLAISIIAVLGPDPANGVPWKLIVIVGISGWMSYARVCRAVVLSIREREFVQSARSLGASDSRILFRHILPNIAGPLVVQTSLSLAFAILSEAALSFLGLGIQPPQPSLGRMIFDSQGFVTLAWWMAVFPGAAIFVTVLAFNLLGDGLRDVLDPKQRTMIEARRKR